MIEIEAKCQQCLPKSLPHSTHTFSPSMIIDQSLYYSRLLEASTFLLRLELLDLVAAGPEEDDEEEENTLGARSLLPAVVGRMNRLGSGSLFSCNARVSDIQGL